MPYNLKKMVLLSIIGYNSLCVSRNKRIMHCNRKCTSPRGLKCFFSALNEIFELVLAALVNRDCAPKTIILILVLRTDQPYSCTLIFITPLVKIILNLISRKKTNVNRKELRRNELHCFGPKREKNLS